MHVLDEAAARTQTVPADNRLGYLKCHSVGRECCLRSDSATAATVHGSTVDLVPARAPSGRNKSELLAGVATCHHPVFPRGARRSWPRGLAVLRMDLARVTRPSLRQLQSSETGGFRDHLLAQKSITPSFSDPPTRSQTNQACPEILDRLQVRPRCRSALARLTARIACPTRLGASSRCILDKR